MVPTLNSQSAGKEDITHCWKLFFFQLKMRFPLSAQYLFELSKNKSAISFIQWYTLNSFTLCQCYLYLRFGKNLNIEILEHWQSVDTLLRNQFLE